MRAFSVLVSACGVSCYAALTAMAWAAPPARDTITINTTPAGATVEWNRKVIGKTPLVFKVGEFAFNAHKSSLLSKHLDQPVNLRVTMEGYNPVNVTITGDPLVWVSLNGQNRFTYYVIGLQDYTFKLDKKSVVPTTMTNASVVELWKAGFGEDLIIEKINNTATAFNLEVADLIGLKNAGIPDGILQAMMRKTDH